MSSTPLLDVVGFTRRTMMAPGDVSLVDTLYPGFIVSRIAVRQAQIQARLIKRYAAILPFAQTPAQPRALGTSPPAVTFTGTPATGCVDARIEITTGGDASAALFRWSADGGSTWTAEGVQVAPSVPLGATGIVATFPAGVYATDNVYVAPTPAPETVLGWLAALVSADVYDRRGRDPSDPAMQTLQARYDEAIAELKEVADSENGLLELPANDGAPATSAINAGGPYSYSEPDPYCWMDQQREASRGRW